MPRKSYYKPYRRNYPKKKWASNIKQGTLNSSSTSTTILVENSSAGSSPTPVIVKAGNFKVQGDVNISGTTSGNQAAVAFLFICFVPEGIGISSSDMNGVINQHPEWVIAWTALDCPVTSGTNLVNGSKFSLTSRLKRNLNSGDRIVAYVQSTVAGVGVTASYTAQYFTCAN